MKLYLTSEEQKAFSILAHSLKEDWSVENEGVIPLDTEDQRLTRFALLSLRDEKAKSIADKTRGASMDQIVAVIQDTDLSNISNADLSELFFALGSQALTGIIDFLLASVSTDSDLEDISALTLIRHSML